MVCHYAGHFVRILVYQSCYFDGWLFIPIYPRNSLLCLFRSARPTCNTPYDAGLRLGGACRFDKRTGRPHPARPYPYSLCRSFQRDTLTWQRLFHPLGLLAFALVALPWYILMYSYHGMAFIEEFLGLHNVVRATIPEHPEQNWWFMYFVLWPVSLLPWTGLTIYELIYGERNSWFKYLLTWGLGVFIFYNLMATKYITYTFLCIIPFIILTAQGYIRLKGHLLRNIPPREVKVIAMAPDSDFCWLPQQTKSYSKNLLVLLPAFLLVAIAIIGVWLGSRTQPDVDSSQLSIALSIGAVLCVLPLLYALIRPHICRSIKAVAISTSILYVLLLCALPPIVDDASTEKLADTLALRPTTQMYYYRDYRTSLVYYTGHSVTQIIPDPDAETIWDKGKKCNACIV